MNNTIWLYLQLVLCLGHSLKGTLRFSGKKLPGNGFPGNRFPGMDGSVAIKQYVRSGPKRIWNERENYEWDWGFAHPENNERTKGLYSCCVFT